MSTTNGGAVPPMDGGRGATVNAAILCAREAGVPDEQLPKFERFVTNVMSMRQELINRMIDPRRSIADECGYPAVITTAMYHLMYDRDPISARVVEIMPRESWQMQPRVYESEDADLTPFEASWKKVLAGLSGRKSWFADEEGSLLWTYLRDADIQAGIGRYAVVVLGLDDGKDLEEPAEPKEEMQLKYLRVFPEFRAPIESRETDQTNERFGQAIYYNITFDDPNGTVTVEDIGNPTSTTTVNRRVHWTRVIHISEGEVYGIPRMQQVFNNLQDLRKLYGGSAEMYWRGAFPGFSLETDPRLGGDVPYDVNATRDMMEKYMNGLQRYLALNGFSAKSLAPQVVDPTPQINVHLGAICIKLAVPMRIFQGSERGHLASNQDESSWTDRVVERRNTFNTPRCVMPLVDRLVWLKVCVEPSDPLHVLWPDLDAQTEDQKVSIAQKVTQCLGSYVTTGGEAVLTPYWFLTKILGWEDDEATAALKDTLGAIEEQDSQPSNLLAVAGGLNGMIELFKLAQSGGLSEEQLKATMMLFFRLSEDQADEIIADGIPEPTPPAPNPFGGGTPAPAGGFGGTPRNGPSSPVGATSGGRAGKTTSGLGGAGGGGRAPVPAGTVLNNEGGSGITANIPFGVVDGRFRRIDNAFCATGEGGGVDPSCSPEYSSMSIEQLIATRSKLDRDMAQERSAINPKDPHADLRSSVAHSNLRTLNREHAKVELEIARRSNDKIGIKYHTKRLKNLLANSFCATGEGGGVDPSCSPSGSGGGSAKAKFIGAKVGKAEHVHSAKVEEEVTSAVQGVNLEDNEPLDVRVGTPGGKEHAIEVKSLLKGKKTSISVHEDALLRKVDYAANNPKATFHTVVVDERASYENGAHAANYSGHRIYYKRGSGRYSLSKMQKVSSMAELHTLIHASDAKLPAAAKGSLPSGSDTIEKLREAATKAHSARLTKDRARKARLKAEKTTKEK